MTNDDTVTHMDGQRTLGAFGAGDVADEGDDWPPYDDYGPTMDRPLPREEDIETWKRRLNHHGFSWQVLWEESSHGGLPDYHINDRDRPRDREIHREQMAAREAAGAL